MRLQTFYLFNIQLEAKDRFKTVEKFMPFSWEDKQEENEDEPITDEIFAIMHNYITEKTEGSH